MRCVLATDVPAIVRSNAHAQRRERNCAFTHQMPARMEIIYIRILGNVGQVATRNRINFGVCQDHSLSVCRGRDASRISGSGSGIALERFY